MGHRFLQLDEVDRYIDPHSVCAIIEGDGQRTYIHLAGQEQPIVSFSSTRTIKRMIEAARGLPGGFLAFTVYYPHIQLHLKGVTSMVMTDTQQVVLSVQPVDAHGHPAAVEGPPAWATSDPTVVSLEVAGDGMSAIARAAGALGTAQVSVQADADLGAGVETIAGVLQIDILPGKAVGLNISAGTPTEIGSAPLGGG